MCRDASAKKKKRASLCCVEWKPSLHVRPQPITVLYSEQRWVYFRKKTQAKLEMPKQLSLTFSSACLMWTVWTIIQQNVTHCLNSMNVSVFNALLYLLAKLITKIY